MWKVSVAALALFGWFAVPASALELKNVRAVYGIFGPARPDTKILPGDVLRLTFDITGLKVDEKSGAAKYHVSMELLDSKSALVFKKETPTTVTLSLGGNQVPGYAELQVGSDQTPGKYTLKVTVKDLLGNDTKNHTHPFEIQAESFGFVHLFAPVAGLTGQNYAANYLVTGMTRDARKKPNVSIRMRVLDAEGKPVHPKPFTMEIPKDLPEEMTAKIDTMPFVPLEFPLFLNRPGQFVIEVEGTDNLSKKTAKLRFPLTVLDPDTYGGK